MQSEPAVISLGSINADFQMRVDRWTEAGEDLLATEFVRCGGGKGANVAYAAHRLGAPVVLIGHVGDDDLAEQALNPLRKLQLDLSRVSAVPRTPTGFVTVVVTPDGKKTMIAAHNANDIWRGEEAAKAASVIADAAAGSILVTDCAIASDPVEKCARAAGDTKIPVVLDPSPAERVSDRLFGLADFVTPNPAEARRLTGIAVESIDDAIRAGRVFLGRGTKTALMKLPHGGCVAVSDPSITVVRTVPVKVVDTTGAGDCFAGAFAVASLEGQSVAEAVRFAVAAAHVSVTRYTAQASYPDRAEVEEMLQRVPPAQIINKDEI